MKKNKLKEVLIKFDISYFLAAKLMKISTKKLYDMARKNRVITCPHINTIKEAQELLSRYLKYIDKQKSKVEMYLDEMMEDK